MGASSVSASGCEEGFVAGRAGYALYHEDLREAKGRILRVMRDLEFCENVTSHVAEAVIAGGTETIEKAVVIVGQHSFIEARETGCQAFPFVGGCHSIARTSISSGAVSLAVGDSFELVAGSVE